MAFANYLDWYFHRAAVNLHSSGSGPRNWASEAPNDPERIASNQSVESSRFQFQFSWVVAGQLCMQICVENGNQACLNVCLRPVLVHKPPSCHHGSAHFEWQEYVSIIVWGYFLWVRQFHRRVWYICSCLWDQQLREVGKNLHSYS